VPIPSIHQVGIQFMDMGDVTRRGRFNRVKNKGNESAHLFE